MSKILQLNDSQNFKFYFKKYWNSFVRSDTPKLHFTLEEFLNKMQDDDYLRTAINKMEYQDRLISCQYIKSSKKQHGFANFFLMRLPRTEKLHCNSEYYFIYKTSLNTIENIGDNIFLPKRSIYKRFNIEADSFEYLANFSVPISEGDKIYCLKCDELINVNEIFNNDIVNL